MFDVEFLQNTLAAQSETLESRPLITPSISLLSISLYSILGEKNNTIGYTATAEEELIPGPQPQTQR